MRPLCAWEGGVGLLHRTTVEVVVLGDEAGHGDRCVRPQELLERERHHLGVVGEPGAGGQPGLQAHLVEKPPGVEAVIDKDRTAGLLASGVGADRDAGRPKSSIIDIMVDIGPA